MAPAYSLVMIIAVVRLHLFHLQVHCQHMGLDETTGMCGLILSLTSNDKLCTCMTVMLGDIVMCNDKIYIGAANEYHPLVWCELTNCAYLWVKNINLKRKNLL